MSQWALMSWFSAVAAVGLAVLIAAVATRARRTRGQGAAGAAQPPGEGPCYWAVPGALHDLSHPDDEELVYQWLERHLEEDEEVCEGEPIRGLRVDAPARIVQFDGLIGRMHFTTDAEGETYAPRTDGPGVHIVLELAALDLEDWAVRTAARWRREHPRVVDVAQPATLAEFRRSVAGDLREMQRDTSSLLAYLWYAELQARQVDARDGEVQVAYLVAEIASAAQGFQAWFLEYGDLNGEGDLQRLVEALDALRRMAGPWSRS